MYQFETDMIERSLSEQKSLLVNVSRGLDRLAGKRGGRKERTAPGSTLIRQIVSHVIARCRGEQPEDAARRLYGGDVASTVQRAVSSPASTATSGYALEVDQHHQQQRAARPGTDIRLCAAFHARPVDRHHQRHRKDPDLGRISALLPVKFTGEGLPISVGSLGLLAASLIPYKLATICFFTEELSECSVPSIEQVIRQAMDEDVGRYLVSIIFGSAASSATQPAGLFNGVTPLAATAGTGLAAVAGDMSKLLAAIAPASAPALVGNVATVAKLGVWASTFLSVPVITSEEHGGEFPCCDRRRGGGYCRRTDQDPDRQGRGASCRYRAQRDCPVGATSISSPTTSMFQSDLVGLRLTTFASWGLRAQGSAAIINSVTW